MVRSHQSPRALLRVLKSVYFQLDCEKGFICQGRKWIPTMPCPSFSFIWDEGNKASPSSQGSLQGRACQPLLIQPRPPPQLPRHLLLPRQPLPAAPRADPAGPPGGDAAEAAARAFRVAPASPPPPLPPTPGRGRCVPRRPTGLLSPLPQRRGSPPNQTPLLG